MTDLVSLLRKDRDDGRSDDDAFLKWAAADRIEQLEAAFNYMLPYVHVDIRAQALVMMQSPLENYIGSLGGTNG